MKHALTAALLAIGSAQATDLRIYPNFSEVRAPVQVSGREFTLSLPLNVWQNLLPGTLDLEGLDVLARVQLANSSWLEGLEGKTLTLRGPDGKTEPVTLVRASDLTVKDAAGQYRTARYEDLGFPQLPPENARAQTQTTFSLAAPGGGTLSYLTRAITWNPRYTLKLSGTTGSLSALAEIRNNSDQPYAVKTTELLAGEVNIEGGQPVPYAQLSTRAAADAAPGANKINALGELRGLYRYQLSEAFTLPKQSIISLPFLRPKISFERYAALNTGFDATGSKGKLNRAYRVKSDVLLPAGVVTVRDDGRLVGQVSIGDTSAKDPIDLNVGSDPDMSYTRAVQVLRQDKTGGSYRVTYTVENAKDRPLRAEIREGVGGNVTVDGAERTPEGSILVKADVPAKGKVTKTFTVTIKYGN